MADMVTFSYLNTSGGKRVAFATLNKPSSLNALNIDMIRDLTPQLMLWQCDDNIACVVLSGEGGKAFCAGGDVVAMHNAMVEQQDNEVPASLQAFFTEEYELDYLIHTFAKPIIVWGNGIVMGGGMGLMNGGSHRIVTESSRLAMPEISIGLYPDVGGSWFLNKMPGGSGLFLGLTGASMNASDALYLGLADYALPDASQQEFMRGLAQLSWKSDAPSNAIMLSEFCSDFSGSQHIDLLAGNVAPHQATIDQCCTDMDGQHPMQVTSVVERILGLQSENDRWLSKAQKTLAAGSPISAHLVYEQLRRARELSLSDCFRMELIMSCRCGELGEFQEGVRALLIDKDNQPVWRFKSVSEVSSEVIEQFFTPLWGEATHPLVSLGL